MIVESPRTAPKSKLIGQKRIRCITRVRSFAFPKEFQGLRNPPALAEKKKDPRGLFAAGFPYFSSELFRADFLTPLRSSNSPLFYRGAAAPRVRSLLNLIKVFSWKGKLNPSHCSKTGSARL